MILLNKTFQSFTDDIVEFKIPDLNLTIKLIHDPNKRADGKAVSWAGNSNNSVKITFHNFSEGLGSGPTDFHSLGTNNSKEILFSFFQHKAGNLHLMSFQIMVEE